MEDSFVKILFIFIAQHFYYHPSSKDQHKESAASRFESHRESPICSNFPWLQIDISPDDCRDFFPAEVVKGILPNEHNPVELKLSVILESFRQFYQAAEGLKRENQSLQMKAKMFEEVVKKNRILESKLYQQHAQALTVPAASPDPPEKTADLEKQIGLLQNAYTRSEDRCKQLVDVTQQWAIECGEKVNLINVLEKEIEQLKADVESLDNRVAKYKRYWVETKDQARDKVSDSQFEELRSELASRRELYDQVRNS